MTTTPGAARGILVAGARKHWTQQAMAPRRTTTPSMAVRIHLSHPPPHPQYIHLFCLLVSSVSAGLWLSFCTALYVPTRVFLWASVCRRRCEGEGDEVCGCRSQRVTAAAGGWVVYWDGTMMSVLNSCGRPAAGADVACQCWRDIWSHWLRKFQANWNRVLNQVCWNSRCHKVTCRLVSLCNSRTSLLIQCINYWLFYPLTFSLTSSLSDRFFPAPFAFSLQNCSIWVDLPFHLPLHLCDSLTLTAGVPYPVLFMSGKISH